MAQGLRPTRGHRLRGKPGQRVTRNLDIYMPTAGQALIFGCVDPQASQFGSASA